MKHTHYTHMQQPTPFNPLLMTVFFSHSLKQSFSLSFSMFALQIYYPEHFFRPFFSCGHTNIREKDRASLHNESLSLTHM